MGVLHIAHSHPQTGPLRYCAACDAPTGTNQPYRLRVGCVHWTIEIQNVRFCMFYVCAYLQKAPAWNWRDARLHVACLEWAAALMWTQIPGALQELVANTCHGRHSALTLHSFVRGVLRQLYVGLSPPESGHVPQYEPPRPKISSNDTSWVMWSMTQ